VNEPRISPSRIYKRHGVWWFITAYESQADVKPHPSFQSAVNEFAALTRKAA
jgi:hypothetical protein